MDGDGFALLFQAVNATGTIGVLVFFVWAFYSGRIISETILKRLLEEDTARWTEFSSKIVRQLERIDENLKNLSERQERMFRHLTGKET